MFWIITRVGPEMEDCADRIGAGRIPVAPGSRQFVSHMKQIAPSADALKPLIDGFAEALPFEFRLLNSDDEVHFEGRCGDIDQADADEAFEPQDRFESDTGVTATQYRMVGETDWRDL